jgi:hypothetical protein
LTKRTNKPKATPTVPPTINSTAPVSPVESVKVEGKAKVANKPKQANSMAKKAPQKTVATKTQTKRPRTKKVAEITSPTKVVDAESRIITYVDPMTMAAPTEPKPSLYDQFVGWLFKVTLPFRGY